MLESLSNSCQFELGEAGISPDPKTYPAPLHNLEEIFGFPAICVNSCKDKHKTLPEVKNTTHSRENVDNEHR